MVDELEAGTGRRPRRFRTVSEKRRIAELMFEPGASVASFWNFESAAAAIVLGKVVDSDDRFSDPLEDSAADSLSRGKSKSDLDLVEP